MGRWRRAGRAPRRLPTCAPGSSQPSGRDGRNSRGTVSFTSTQLAAHRACLALREEAGSVAAAVGDDQFVQALRRTLRAWQVGVRGGRLVPDEEFTQALRAALPRLEALEGLT